MTTSSTSAVRRLNESLRTYDRLVVAFSGGVDSSVLAHAALQLLGPDVTVGQATMSNAAWGHEIEDYAAVTFRRGGQVLLMETGYIYPGPTSTFDMHFVLRTPNRYIVAPDQQSVNVYDLDGRVERRRMGTTNVPCYPLFVRDVLARARAGRPPVADLAALVPIMKLVEAAYAAAGWHGGRAPAS